jgi:hypothetical protein
VIYEGPIDGGLQVIVPALPGLVATTRWPSRI